MYDGKLCIALTELSFTTSFADNIMESHSDINAIR